jgi:hypothetical protein
VSVLPEGDSIVPTKLGGLIVTDATALAEAYLSVGFHREVVSFSGISQGSGIFQWDFTGKWYLSV